MFALREAAAVSAKAELEQAETAERAGDLPRAIAVLEAVRQREPGLGYVAYMLGSLYHQQDQNCSRASNAYQRTIELAPEFAPAFSDLGVCEMETGQSEAALKHLKQALTLSPGYVQPAAAIWRIRETQQRKGASVGDQTLERVLLEVPVPAARLAEHDPFDPALGPAVVAEPMAVLSKPEQRIWLEYPQGWHVHEEPHEDIYYVHASREQAEVPGQSFKVGAGVTQVKDASSRMFFINREDPQGSVRAAAEMLCQQLIGQGRLIARHHVRLEMPGQEAMLSLLTFESPFGFVETEYLLQSLAGDTLTMVVMEAPEDEFERYRPLFRRMFSTLRLNAPQEVLHDNAQ